MKQNAPFHVGRGPGPLQPLLSCACVSGIPCARPVPDPARGFLSRPPRRDRGIGGSFGCSAWKQAFPARAHQGWAKWTPLAEAGGFCRFSGGEGEGDARASPHLSRQGEGWSPGEGSARVCFTTAGRCRRHGAFYATARRCRAAITSRCCTSRCRGVMCVRATPFSICVFNKTKKNFGFCF